MSTNFPTSIDSYTTKVDGVDSVLAAHVNNLQDAIVAVETALGAGSGSGTWTPQLKFGGASVGMTGTFNGRYTRIGKLYVCNIYIELTAKGSSTGAATIDLPAIPITTVTSYWLADHRNMNASYIQVGMIPSLGGTAIGGVRGATAAAASLGNLDNSAYTNTSVMLLGGAFFIA